MSNVRKIISRMSCYIMGVVWSFTLMIYLDQWPHCNWIYLVVPLLITCVAVVTIRGSRVGSIVAWTIAGLLTGPAFALLIPPVRVSSTRSPVNRAKSEMQNLSVAIEAYRIDHNAYPLACDKAWHTLPVNDSGVSVGYVSNLLTTPSAFCVSIPLDPFNKSGGPGTARQRYRYATNVSGCWIMSSVGYARKEKTKIEDYCDPKKANCDPKKFFSHFGVGTAVMYDSSNGTESDGEIVRTGP
jgi:hypothetical protein